MVSGWYGGYQGWSASGQTVVVGWWWGGRGVVVGVVVGWCRSGVWVVCGWCGGGRRASKMLVGWVRAAWGALGSFGDVLKVLTKWS